MKQPEALRLADEHDENGWIAGTRQWCAETFAELRRLHEVNQMLLDALEQYANNINWIQDERGIARCWMEPDSDTPKQYHGFELARAAIAKAGEV